MREEHNSWKLPSNDGWSTTSWFVRGAAEIEGEKFLLVEVVIMGKYWDRFKNAQNKGLQYAREYSLVMPQFLIQVSCLKDLQEQLTTYLKTPIKQIANNPPRISEDLCWLDGQTFRIEFGLREGGIGDLGQCLCTISYELNAISGECSYVVDPSCMQVMLDGIERYFRLTSIT